MNYSILSGTDIKVSVVALGCGSLYNSSTWGEQSIEDSVKTIKAAIDVGINFFDTGEDYGNGFSEELLGSTLSGVRNQVVISTKIRPANLARDLIEKTCDNSLKRLKTDYIDLYQIHWLSRVVPISETIEVMEKLRQKGKIRAFGVCNYGMNSLRDLLDVGKCVSNQIPYNLLWRSVEHDIQKICVDNEISILCYSPLAQGLLTGKYCSVEEVPEGRARTRLFSNQHEGSRHREDGWEKETFDVINKIRELSSKVGIPMGNLSLAWLLKQNGVCSVIAGARSPHQVINNAKATEVKLSYDCTKELSGITEDFKMLVGKNSDMWQSDSRACPHKSLR